MTSQKASNFNSDDIGDVDSCLRCRCHNYNLFLFYDRYGVILIIYKSVSFLDCVEQFLKFVDV